MGMAGTWQGSMTPWAVVVPLWWWCCRGASVA